MHVSRRPVEPAAKTGRSATGALTRNGQWWRRWSPAGQQYRIGQI